MKKILLVIYLIFFWVAMAIAAVNINTADQKTLETLPRIGATKAQAIIDYRNDHGDFKAIEELGKVKGIGPKTLEQLKELIEL